MKAGIFVLGAVGSALVALLCLYKSGSNLWSYMNMRQLPVEVTASSLRIDATRPVHSGDVAELFYILDLYLTSTGETRREIHWEEEVPAAYPEEALDELAFWAKGSRHTVQFLRGDAREIRIGGASTNPEAGFAGAFLLASFFPIAMAFAFGMMATGGMERSLDAGGKPWFGPWLGFLLFGIPPLFGSVAWAWVETPKRYEWLHVTATVTHLPPGYQAQLPDNVLVTEAAKPLLPGLQSFHRLDYTWNGRSLRGIIGSSLEGHHHNLLHGEDLNSPTTRFRISPTDRWQLAKRMEFDSDYWVPLGVLALFGVLFTGAAFLIRKFF